MRKLTIKARLIAGFVIVILISTVIGIFTFLKTDRIDDKVDKMIQNKHFLSVATRDINFKIVNIYRTTKNLINAEKENISKEEDRINADNEEILNLMDSLSYYLSNGKDLINGIRLDYINWFRSVDTIINLNKEGKTEECLNIRNNKLVQYDDLFFDRTEKLIEITESDLQRLYAETEDHINDIKNTIIIRTIILLIISLLLAVLISNSILREIKSYSKRLRILLTGQKDVEFGMLNEKQIFETTIKELKGAFEEIQLYGEELKASNDQLHDANNEMETMNEELKAFNEHLEEKVNERTKELTESETRLKKQNSEYYALYEEYKTINEDLIVAKNKAEESDRLKSSFLANLSHEVRTPMNAIVGFSNILQKMSLDKENENKFLGLINASTLQLLDIVNDIVNMSKLEANIEKLFPVSFCPDKMMEEVFQIISMDKAKNEDVNIVLVNESDNSELCILSDETKIKQVLINLLKNSIKFTEKGEVKFSYEAKNGILEFFIEDTGCGIEKDKQGIIFERFRQADETIAVKYGGNGLGLAISKGYVELLGGKIWLESEVNKGTKISFAIPLIKTDMTLSEKTDNWNWKELEGKRVLIAEDSEVNIEFLKAVLVPAKADLFIANNGIDAVNIFKNEKIDIVLMDIQMPLMNGIDASKEILQSEKNAKIIAVTAYCSNSDKRKYKETGFHDLIEKPFIAEMVLYKMMAALAN